MDDLLFFFLGWPLLRRLFGRNSDPFANENDTPAEEILRRRFARGEITREQFEEMRHTLVATGRSPERTPTGI